MIGREVSEEARRKMSEAKKGKPLSDEHCAAIGRGVSASKPKGRNAMQPSIGRIVHYTNLGDKDGKYPPEQQAAIITRVKDGEKGIVSLHIFYPTGQFDMESVPFSETFERGHWSWPPRI